MTNIPKGIIFDLGNVIVDVDYQPAVGKISKFTKIRPQKIYNFFFDSPLTARFEEGKISPQEFFNEVKKTLDLEMNLKEFISIWNGIFFLSKKNLAIHKIIRSLEDKYFLILLSNINKLHFEYLKERLDIFNSFNKLILSYKIKSRKPALKIYKKVLEVSGLPKEKVFYIDDRADLIEKAREYGIKSFCLDGNISELENTFQALGINFKK